MNAHRRAGLDSSRGFTMVEAVIVTAVIACAGALSLYAVRTSSLSRDASSVAREILYTMRMARWKAVVTGERTRWITFSRKGDESLWYAVESRRRSRWVREGEGRRIPGRLQVRITGEREKTFYPDGTSSMGGVVLINPGGAFYRLALNPVTGRTRLYRGSVEAMREH